MKTFVFTKMDKEIVRGIFFNFIITLPNSIQYFCCATEEVEKIKKCFEIVGISGYGSCFERNFIGLKIVLFQN